MKHEDMFYNVLVKYIKNEYVNKYTKLKKSTKGFFLLFNFAPKSTKGYNLT